MRRIAHACCFAALLAGCANYTAQPISPATTAAALESRTLDNPRLQGFLLTSLSPEIGIAPKPDWRLTTLTLTALYYHPDIEIARSRLATSRAAVITAGQRPNPTLSFTAVFGSAISSAFPPGTVPLTVGPVVNFLIETFGKRQSRTAQAQNLAEAAREDLATAAWTVRGRVRTALLNVWTAQQRLKLAQQQLGLRQQLVTLLERRFAAGEATALDVTRERIALTQATLGIRDVNRLEADARVQLATAIGVPVRAFDGVTLSLAAFDAPDTPAAASLSTGPLRRRALTERTDVLASLAQYEAAQSAVKLQVANQYPNLTLGPGYNYDFDVNKFILNPTIDLPIFNQNQGQIAEALANRNQAAATFIALQAQIIGEIDAAGTAYGAATRSLATADSLLGAQQVRQRQSRAALTAGESDRPTLITTDLELAVIRSSRFDVLAAQRQALGALEDALQQPLFDARSPLFAPQPTPRPTALPSMETELK